jgi:ATP-dependent DNA helicase DinG
VGKSPEERTRRVLDAAVHQVRGHDRPGQIEMAQAVSHALESGEHLLVQAGTGTGKSLGYLAPALAYLSDHPGERIVVTTATLALQSQLAGADIPAALAAVESVIGEPPVTAVLKGRTNYACLLKVRDRVGGDQAALISAAEVVDSSAGGPESALGKEVLALREWADEQLEKDGLADRDGAPAHTERAWQQVSIPVRECLGVQRCPEGANCFVEESRDRARASDLIVTNHALLAIDAMHGGTALPDHGAVIIDEAHELVARVTGAASAELSPQSVDRVARRATNYLEDELALEFLESADLLRSALDEMNLERVEDPESPLVGACEQIRMITRRVVSELTGPEEKTDPDRRQVAAAVKEVFDIAERLARLADHDVVWVADRERYGREARVAPLSVAGLLRQRVFADRTAVLTSATLKLGGDFDGVAASVGLRAQERLSGSDVVEGPASRPELVEGPHSIPEHVPHSIPEPVEGPESVGSEAIAWRGLDVGSPFDYQKQGILYTARLLPPPGREGLRDEALQEIAELVWAAGGRTLGLFSSRRAAEVAAVFVRKQLPKLTVLCQGDAQLPELTRRFVAEEAASLFGTLSLWQGVDVPGATCQLVIIDRIPFPRPDEPLMLARQRAVAEAGGNGFMAVAASHAALLLAQGSGRLIRRLSDRGVVAVLDPRLITARYGSFLRASMPKMWSTTDRELVVGALRRLSEQG